MHHRDAAATRGDDDDAACSKGGNELEFQHRPRAWRRHDAAPATPGVLHHVPAERPVQVVRLVGGKKGPDRLGGMCEGRIVLAHRYARDDAGDLAVDLGANELVLEPLHEQIADPALAVRHADIQPHRRNMLARVILAQQDLSDHRPVAVRDDELRHRADQRA